MNFKCKFCNVSFTSDILYQAHLYSSSHEMNIKKFQNRGANMLKSDECKCSSLLQKYEYGWKCTVCQVNLNSFQQVLGHVSGQKHCKLLPFSCRNSSCTEKTLAVCKNISPTVQLSKIKPQTSSVECKCSTYIQKCQDGYMCTLCRVSLNSFQQVQIHVRGQKHLKLLPCKCTYDKALAACNNIPDTVQVSNAESQSSDSYKLFPSTLSYDVPPENFFSKVKVFNVDDEICF